MWVVPGITPFVLQGPQDLPPWPPRAPPFHTQWPFCQVVKFIKCIPTLGCCTCCSLCPKCFIPQYFLRFHFHLLQIFTQMSVSQRGLFCPSYLKYSSTHTRALYALPLIYGFQNSMLCILLLIIIYFVTWVWAGPFVCFVHWHRIVVDLWQIFHKYLFKE